jgi:uncharacterized protein YigE (DUF2233 family)
MKGMLRLSRGRVLGWFASVLGWTFSHWAHAGTVERVEFEGAVYRIFRVGKADQARLDLRWLGDDGKPLGGFGGLLQTAEQERRQIEFATNAGIYEKGPKPCGLTISAGKELVPLNLAKGEGNFFLQPNGVFYLDDVRGAGVMESGEYGRSGLKPRLATQSGPLLLRGGKVHPAFNANSPNRRLRNAVGVRAADGQIVFVMSEREDREKGRVTFYQLVRLYLHLGCQDALFLDGDLSDILADPPKGAQVTPNTYAAMFVLWK